MPTEVVSAKVSDDLKKRIEEFQEEGEHKSDTIRRLLRAGLEHQECRERGDSGPLLRLSGWLSNTAPAAVLAAVLVAILAGVSVVPMGTGAIVVVAFLIFTAIVMEAAGLAIFGYLMARDADTRLELRERWDLRRRLVNNG